MTDSGLKVLLGHETRFKNLAFLNLSNTNLTQPSFELLFRSELIGHLSDLRLSENIDQSIGDSVMKLLETYQENLQSLRILTLGSALDGLDQDVFIPKSLEGGRIQIIPFCGDQDD